MSRNKEGHSTTPNNRRNAIVVGSILTVAFLVVACFMMADPGNSTTGQANASMINGIHAEKTPKPTKTTTTTPPPTSAPSTTASSASPPAPPTSSETSTQPSVAPPTPPEPVPSHTKPPRPPRPTRPPAPTPTPQPAMGLTDIQRYAYSLVGDSNQFACLSNIIRRESGWNLHAANSDGSYGIPQALPGNKMSSEGSDWQSNPKTQLRWMVKYIHSRYGTPCGAWAFWQAHNWY